MIGAGVATALRLPASSSSSSHRSSQPVRGVTRNGMLRNAALSLGAALLPPQAALAEDSAGTVIGQIPASGIIFKDIVKVERIDDPKVEGIELYVSSFQRPITDRLLGDFFSDPAQASVTCVKTGSMKVAADIDTSQEGEEVFSQARSLLFKSINVRRLYDEELGIIVYVSYSNRLDRGDDENKSRFKTTMCAVKVEPPPPRRTRPVPEPAPEPAPELLVEPPASPVPEAQEGPQKLMGRLRSK